MKQRPQLTQEQQQLVARVLPHVLLHRQEAYPALWTFLDFERLGGSPALPEDHLVRPRERRPCRLGELAGPFRLPGTDPDEVRRKNGSAPGRGSVSEPGRAAPASDGTPLAEQIAARVELPVEPEAESHLLRGLDTRTRTIVWKSIVEGLPLKTIAQSLGVSPSPAPARSGSRPSSSCASAQSPDLLLIRLTSILILGSTSDEHHRGRTAGLGQVSGRAVKRSIRRLRANPDFSGQREWVHDKLALHQKKLANLLAEIDRSQAAL